MSATDFMAGRQMGGQETREQIRKKIDGLAAKIVAMVFIATLAGSTIGFICGWIAYQLVGS